MFPAHISVKNPSGYSRCEERRQAADPKKSLSPIRQTEAALKESIYHALWKEDVLQAIENDAIDVHVHQGIVHLYGHIVNSTSRIRIMNAIRTFPGILSLQNHLVLDDQLTLEVAASLGNLEHTYACKFFTGTSHGVVSLNGTVRDQNVKTLAEKCVASNPHVRGVINHVRVSGTESKLREQPFLQPAIGEIIYFLDGVSGTVKQVIINPNTRRVVAMIVLGRFASQQQELQSESRPPEHLIVLSMDLVRYLTRVSGFLYINSTERNRYLVFDSAAFSTPHAGWAPPYPYCSDEVLFPLEKREVKYQILKQPHRSPLRIALDEQLLWEQLANDSLGG